MSGIRFTVSVEDSKGTKTREYVGFNACMDANPPDWAKWLAVANGASGLEVWWLENDSMAITQLESYYHKEQGRTPRIHVYEVSQRRLNK